MADYITKEDIEDYVDSAMLAKLVRESEDTEAYNTIIENIINRAESRVNGYLGARYTVPVEATGLIKDYCLVIVAYHVQLIGKAPNVQKKVKEEYDNTLSELKRIANGKQDIGGVTPLEKASGFGFAVVSDVPIFDEANLDCF